MSDRTKQVQFRMPDELHTELKAALAYDRSSFADFFNKAAEDYLSNHHNNHQIFIDDWYNILLPDFDTLNIFSEEDLQEVFEKEKQNGGTKNG